MDGRVLERERKNVGILSALAESQKKRLKPF
jgi:hypothetical protein